MSTNFDRRVTPARPDLAAAHLRGKVDSESFVEGRVMQVGRGVAGLYSAPAADAYNYFGLTAEKIAAKITAFMKQRGME